jgi:tetraacyldisaccharide 4'-kinase
MYKLYHWIEEYLFYPTSLLQKSLAYFLLPLTLLYCIVIYIKRTITRPVDHGIPVVSVGNLIVGGSGKTPFTIALAREYDDVAVVLRGYGRASKGCIVVSEKGKVEVDVKTSGDEAALYASMLPNADVIVSEDRVEGIERAKQLGAKVVFLDDGHSKYGIKKLDILLQPNPEPSNLFCLPSGGYREPRRWYGDADIVAVEDHDYRRNVVIDPFDRAILITAISKPQRLEPYLHGNRIVEKIYFPDHHSYSFAQIDRLMQQYQVDTIVTTEKDYVKLEPFGFKVARMHLSVEIDRAIKERVRAYVL